MDQTIFPYAGYEMRSYSETIWAKFMDALRVRWIYEPQVMETRHGWYLPDFYLPACGMYLEVKGQCPTTKEIEKAGDVEAKTGFPVVFAHGGSHCRGNPWYQGTLAYFAPAGAVTMSMTEACNLVRKYYGDREYARVLQSRSIEYFDGTRMAGELVWEMLNRWMDRETLEESKRLLHTPLNAATQNTHGQTSRPEFIAAEFVRRIQAKRQKVAA
jgi:hypothetical protein